MRAKLAAFKAKHGHCRVPRKHPADPKLSGWVSTQRKCKKKLEAGHPSPQITAERVAKLEALGFEWVAPSTDEAGWETMRAKLAAFKAEHGHCQVPGKHSADPKLGSWVASQREFKKRLDAIDSNPVITSESPASSLFFGTQITAERVAKLEAIGFVWVVSKRKR